MTDLDHSKPLAYLAEKHTRGPHGLFACADTRVFRAQGWAERWAKRPKFENCTVEWRVTPLYAKP